MKDKIHSFTRRCTSPIFFQNKLPKAGPQKRGREQTQKLNEYVDTCRLTFAVFVRLKSRARKLSKRESHERNQFVNYIYILHERVYICIYIFTCMYKIAHVTSNAPAGFLIVPDQFLI